MMNDIGYAAARLLFYTEPSDRALAGWQPFSPLYGLADDIMTDVRSGRLSGESIIIARSLGASSRVVE